MNIIAKLFSNHVLNIAALSWLLAQVIKGVIVLITQKKFDFKRFTGSGGMPSSHSAFVCSMAAAIFKIEHFSSPLFALSCIIAIIVMYDAAGVRRAAGEQAKILNRVVNDWNKTNSRQLQKELKEFLGHTRKEVIIGAFLGIAVALIYTSFIK